MKHWLRDHSLSLVLLALFLFSFGGQVVAGLAAHNSDLALHGDAAIDLGRYLGSGHFLSATFENWESEFLQMALYVALTAFLIEKGSPESRKPGGANPEDADPAERRADAGVPWPVRAGGWIMRLYSYSLGIALGVLFAISFWLHLAGSTRRANEEALRHGDKPTDMAATLSDAGFWYESFQNWQSEFLSMAVLIVLSVYLRHRGSPESKPVAAPHNETGH